MKQNTKSKIKIIIISIFVFILFAIGSSLGYFWYSVKSSVSHEAKEVEFEILEGERITRIAEDLKSKNLIRNKWVFVVYAKLSGDGAKLKAGEYILSPSMNVPEIIGIFVEGKIDQIKITIPEGLTLNEIADLLEKSGLTSKEDFLDVVTQTDFSYSFLSDKPKDMNLEGYLFPDTYFFYPDASAKDIVERMLDNFKEKVTSDILNKGKEQGLDYHEILTLASIVEKEVSKDEDRKIVAGVFYKRLAAGMPLESDATVNYITKKDLAQPTLEDTRKASPYNTYLNKGLPPGPICNPGLSAILAVSDPESSDYWYYLNDQKTGQTIFSKTYEEHLENKDKYLR